MPIFRHKKTNLLHRVLHDDARLLGTAEPMVVYRSIHGGRPWVVPRSEFERDWEIAP